MEKTANTAATALDSAVARSRTVEDASSTSGTTTGARVLHIVLIVFVILVLAAGAAIVYYHYFYTNCIYDTKRASACSIDDLRDLINTYDQHVALRDLLRRLDAAFEFASSSGGVLPYWIVSGTLLGAIRDRAIVPWDDDGDIGVMYGEWKAALDSGQLERALHAHGLLYESATVGGIARIRLAANPSIVFCDVFGFEPTTEPFTERDRVPVEEQEAARRDVRLVHVNTYARYMFPTETYFRSEVFPLQRYVIERWAGHDAAARAAGINPEVDKDRVEVWGPARPSRTMNAQYGGNDEWRRQLVVTRHDALSTMIRPCRISLADFRALFSPHGAAPSSSVVGE